MQSWGECAVAVVVDWAQQTVTCFPLYWTRTEPWCPNRGVNPNLDFCVPLRPYLMQNYTLSTVHKNHDIGHETRQLSNLSGRKRLTHGYTSDWVSMIPVLLWSLLEFPHFGISLMLFLTFSWGLSKNFCAVVEVDEGTSRQSGKTSPVQRQS